MHTIYDALREKRLGNIDLSVKMIDELIEVEPLNSWYKLEAIRLKLESSDYVSAEAMINDALKNKNSRDLFNIYTAGIELNQAKGNEVEAMRMARGGYEFKKTVHAAIPYLKLLKQNNLHLEMNELFDDFMASDARLSEKNIFLNKSLPIINLQYISNESFSDRWGKNLANEAIDNACIVMLVKNEEDIIHHAIRNNYNQGFRNFLVLNNGSTDSTYEKILDIRKELPDSLILVNDDLCKEYKQSFKTTLAANYAVEYFKLFSKKIDWVFPLDADEFLCSSKNIKNILDDLPDDKRILVFTLRNIAPKEINHEISIDSSIEDIFSLNNNSVLYSNPTVKVAFRPTGNFIISQGNHSVENLIDNRSQLHFFAKDDICLNHLPIRSIKQIKNKTIGGAEAVKNIEGGEHWRSRYDFFLKQGDDYFVKLINNFINEMTTSRG